jgi:alpha-1,3-mannosylglycoprotein beta-1,4-N-acetylglucosaminyltransferase A/B
MVSQIKSLSLKKFLKKKKKNFILKDKIVDKNLVENIEELKQRILNLEDLLISKENDINNLKESFASNVRYYNNLLDKLSNNATIEIKKHSLSSELSLVKNNDINDLVYKFNYDIELPNSIDFLPHLNGHAMSMQPKFKLTKNRFTNLVIGIPTIKRDKTSYLLETIKSLFDSMNEKEKENVLVVVMIAEVSVFRFCKKN